MDWRGLEIGNIGAAARVVLDLELLQLSLAVMRLNQVFNLFVIDLKERDLEVVLCHMPTLIRERE